MNRLSPCPIFALALLALAPLPAAPTIERTADQIRVTLDSRAELRFALEGDLFLGLQRAAIAGRPLKSDATCQWPMIDNDVGPEPSVAFAYRLRSAEIRDGKAVLTLDMETTTSKTALRRLYLFGPDREAALADPDEPLRKAIAANDRATSQIQAAVKTDPQMIAAAQKATDARTTADAAPEADRKRLRRSADEAERERAKLEKELPALLAGEQPAIAEALAQQTAYETELNRRGLEIGKIHRDAHRFPIVRLPSEAITPGSLEELAALPSSEPRRPGGTVEWIVESDSETIGGWPWKGWRHQFRVTAAPGQKFNYVRMLGTWEIGGNAAGLGVVNFRYRGLGPIAHTFGGDATSGVTESWTTTETLPGAVQKAPMISPVLPNFTAVTDRGYGLQHRAGSWIARLPRGGGVNFIDFQHRPDTLFAGFPVRQGNLRAVTEAFTGDRQLSQTDEEIFPVGGELSTTPFRYLALAVEEPFPPHEIRTRWGEIDGFVRDEVSRELGFVQYEPEPAQGFIVDNGWLGWMQSLTQRLDAYAELGIRNIGSHNPGWINGRYQGPDGPPRTGGGVCLVYDWIPTKDVEAAWRQMADKMRAHGMSYYVWFGTYNWADAPFVRSVGTGDEFWSVKYDGVTVDDGGGAVAPHNYLHPRTRSMVTERLDFTRTRFGFTGLWIDSFQSTGLHRFTRDGRHAPQQRATWEWLAEWSRKGVGLQAESMAFPGQSVSIEVDYRDPAQWWYLRNTTLWFRGRPFPDAGTDQADFMHYRMMAVKCQPTTQEPGPPDPVKRVPSFKRFAHEYNAALPDMRRGYLLPGDAGTLWLPYRSNAEGIWFSFADQPVPAGIAATALLDGTPAGSDAKRHVTYRVKATDLVRAFGLRTPPAMDERIGRPFELPKHRWDLRPVDAS